MSIVAFFNKNFKISLDGKFVGSGTLAKFVDIEHLYYKVNRYLRGDYRKPLPDVLRLRLNRHSINLYFC